jgi:hypothetical protein
MFSPKRITPAATVALALGAIAAPAATAGPIGDNVTVQLRPAPALQRAKPSQPVPANPTAGAPAYARQDKQLVPSSPTQAPFTAAPTVVRASNPNASFDWGDAGIGAAGGLVLSIAALTGGLALSQRRARRTGTSTVATG